MKKYCDVRLKPWLAAFVFFCLAVSHTSFACAEKQSFYSFSADVPKGWKVAEEGRLVMFSDAREQCTFSVLEVPLFNDDLAFLMAEQARTTNVAAMKAVDKNLGMIFASEQSRSWGIVPGDVFVFIDVAKACSNLEAQLKSLHAEQGGQNPRALAKAFEALARPEVMGWLAKGRLPAGALAVPVPPDPETIGAPLPALQDLGGAEPPFMAVEAKGALPEGWSKSEQGLWTVFSRDGGKQWLAVRIYAFDSHKVSDENMKAYDDFAVSIARSLGGINIMTGGGMTSFASARGYTGSAELGENCVTVRLSSVTDPDAFSDLVTSVFQGKLEE